MTHPASSTAVLVRRKNTPHPTLRARASTGAKLSQQHPPQHASQRLHRRTTLIGLCALMGIAVLVVAAFFLPTAKAASGRSLLQGGSVPSPAASGDCCAAIASLKLSYTADLPIMIVDTKGLALEDKQTKLKATVCTCSPSGKASEDGIPYTPDLQAQAASVQVRGSSSRANQKKSFKLTLRDGNNAKKRAALFGMPAGADWVMYGPESDRAMGLRNVLAFGIGRALGGMGWQPRTRYAEVFLVQDGKPLSVDHYWGLYLATEKIEVEPQRVNITKAGGYMLGYENDNIEPDEIVFTTPGGIKMVMHYPGTDAAPRWARTAGKALPVNATPQEALQPALSEISAFWEDLAGVVLPKGWDGRGPAPTPATGPTQWREHLDLAAFADYMLATEAAKNPDGYRGSVYMRKDVSSPLVMGPLWDYNEAFGICCGYPIRGFDRDGISQGSSGGSGISPEGWRFNICDEPARCEADPVDGLSRYYRATWQNAEFRQAVASRWRTARAAAISDQWLADKLKGLVGHITPAALRNFGRWSSVLSSPFFKSLQEQFAWEVDMLAAWLQARMQWMDAALADAAAGGMGKTPHWQRSASHAPTPALPGTGTGSLGALAGGPGLPAMPLVMPAQGGLLGSLLGGGLARSARK